MDFFVRITRMAAPLIVIVAAVAVAGCSQQKAELGSTHTVVQQDEAKRIQDLHIPDSVKQRLIRESASNSH